jgi:two-component system chemotaxis response regulator CheB
MISRPGTTNERMRQRDLIVVGSSAGGVDAVPRLVGQLGKELRVCMLVVQHMAPTSDSQFVHIIRRASLVPVAWAEQGERLQDSRVLVAPRDLHMMVADGHVRLSAGPRENYVRPSIDRLFRSAAAIHGPRAIGVLLTGMMEDGVAGLRAIQEAGGFTIVQDPDEAAFNELPSRALQTMNPDRVLRLDAIGELLLSLTAQSVAAHPIPSRVALEAELDADGPASPEVIGSLGPQTTMACPDCGGPLWEIGDEQLRRYRCYLGHAITARELLRKGGEQIEAALWSAIRSLHDRASTYATLAEDAGRSGKAQLHQLYVNRAREARAEADLARQFMRDLTQDRAGDVPG